MTQSCTMKLIVYLISAVLLVVCLQSIEAKNVYQGNSIDETIFGNALIKPERDLRGFKDVGAKIRQAAIYLWNYIKTVAEKTNQKINILIENIKDHATELKESFEAKLAELKYKLNNFISELYGTGELFKQCIEVEKENIDDILKGIMANMGECIAEEINKLKHLTSDEPRLAMNETTFLRELDNMVGMCELDTENIPECLFKVGEDIFDNVKDMENDIVENHFEMRNIAADVKETLVTCAINNLIEATNSISIEFVEIAKCVLETKENELEPLE